jgi:hypothetical protein
VTKLRPPLDPDNPQTDYQVMPRYYETADVPHILARVRSFQRFFDNHVDGKYPHIYDELHGAAIDMLSADLAPYAFDLAISLIALEDSIRTRPPRRRR